MHETNQRVAMFIDADNAPSRKVGHILAELASLGAVSIRRAYGNWKSTRLESWVDVLHEHAIQPVQQFDLVKGKMPLTWQWRLMRWTCCTPSR